MIKLTLLGSVSATALTSLTAVDDARRSLPPGKPVALLAYLACAPGQAGSRGRLVDLLWSDVDADAAKHALRQTLWYIRRRLGDECVLTEGDALRLTDGFVCDRTEFLAAIAADDLERAATQYAGDFFPGFAAPGGAEFERWADIERAHLRGLFVRAAEDVARRWMTFGNARPAIGLARRARDADPENESTWRLLLEALLAASDRLGAATEADALERRLAADEREPELLTRSVIRAVRQADQSPAVRTDSRTSLAAELVGREQEFGTIINAWDRVRTGAAEHVHITAPAGLGKTRLIADIEARLRASRARVVRLRAAPGERSMPYALAAQVASALARLRGGAGVSAGAASALVALNPAVSTWLTALPDMATGDDVLRRRTLAMHELLQAVAAETPLALLIDDLHWADEASRQLLVGLAAHIQNTATLLLTASRPPSPFPVDGASMRLLPLVPLDAAQVGAMMASIAEFPSEEWAERLPAELFGATGGSPLLVLEMLQFALDQGRLCVDAEGWRCPDSSALFIALRPGRAVERRIAELDAAARQVLVLLAMAGVPVSSVTVADALDRSEAEAEATLARLEQLGLVARDGTAWLPQHDEIASAAMAAVDEDTQRRSQRGLATAFSRGPKQEMAAMRRALSHALASGDDALQSRLAREYVSLARARGETRRATTLIGDACGADVSPALIRGLVTRLPVSERIAWKRPAQLLAAAVGVIVMATMAVRQFSASPRESADTLLLRTAVAGDTSVYTLDLDADDATGNAPIDVRRGDRAGSALRSASTLSAPSEIAARGTWVGYRIFAGDSGNLNLVVLDPSGRERQVALHREDDVAPSISPDGRLIVFLTRRFHLKSFALDLALVDVTTGIVNQLTNDEDAEGVPHFSPDGTRIAFMKEGTSPAPLRVCVMLLDGTRTRCMPIPGYLSSGDLVFDNANSVVVEARRSEAKSATLMRVNITTGAITPIDSGAVSYVVSPDGVLAYSKLPDDAQGVTRSYLFALRDPTRKRMLRADSGTISDAVWRASRPAGRGLEVLRIDHDVDTVPFASSSTLRYHAYNAAGSEITIAEPQWRSLDTAVATIDDHGTLMPRQPGQVTIVASAGGYRQDRVTFTIKPSRVTELAEENWTAGVDDRWQHYGTPAAHVIRAKSGDSVMLLNGDGNYFTGVFSNARVPMPGGGGIEFLASIPVHAPKWQSLKAELLALPDSAVVNAWRDRDLQLPRDWDDGANRRNCSLIVPAREGPEAVDKLALMIGGVTTEVAAPRNLTNGAWHHIRLQLFPDGRCGVAVDGHPLLISEQTLMLDRRMNILFDGRSIGTEVVVGKVRQWQGVDAGVDWLAFERKRVTAAR